MPQLSEVLGLNKITSKVLSGPGNTNQLATIFFISLLRKERAGDWKSAPKSCCSQTESKSSQQFLKTQGIPGGVKQEPPP